MSKRKQHAPEFEAKVVLEVLKDKATVSQLASRLRVQSIVGASERRLQTPQVTRSIVQRAHLRGPRPLP